MKVPRLFKIINIRDLLAVLGINTVHERDIAKFMLLLRNHNGDIILTPNYRYIVPPYILLSSGHRTTKIQKVVSKDVSISPSVLDKPMDLGSEHMLGSKYYIKRTSLNTLL